uniref:BTB domain-containing protein n=1 Tax=Panagrolaimus sp. ES5 TaxID=591445 RepID=A0AC34F2Z5_9BILA
MSMAKRISFNVGGRIFETTEQTIRRIPDTRLTSLLDGSPDSDEFFIDHDPRYFEVVLNFLRSRSFPQDYAENIIDDVEREAKFYGISELANCCRTLREPLKMGDEVQWRKDAIEHYWRNFVQCVVDNSLKMPFTFEKNSHFFAKCIACAEEYDPKTSNVYDVHVDDWSALSHHMLSLKGKIIQIFGQTCVMVKFENNTTVHLPRTAVKRVGNLLDLSDKTTNTSARKAPLTSTASVR